MAAPWRIRKPGGRVANYYSNFYEWGKIKISDRKLRRSQSFMIKINERNEASKPFEDDVTYEYVQDGYLAYEGWRKFYNLQTGDKV